MRNGSSIVYAITPQNLTEFNAELSRLGFVGIDSSRLEQLRSTEGRERLLKAINMANSDQGAMAYLAKLFQAASGPSQGPSPAPTRQNLPAAQPPSPARQPEPSRTAPPASRPSAEAPAAASGEQKRERVGKHVYGSRAALYFEADVSRQDFPTIYVDAADAIGTRQYDWPNKIRIQLTAHELPVITAVLLGLLPEAEFKNHGENKDKGFSIKDQGRHLFMEVWAKDQKKKAVQIIPEDAFYLSHIFIRQMRQSAPWMSGMDLISALKMVIVTRKLAASHPGQQGGHGAQPRAAGGYRN